MAFCDLSDTLALVAVSLDGEVIQDQRISTDMLAFDPGAPHAGAHPLDDQAAFQLGDDHDGPAQWSSGIDALPEADELDADSVQFVQHFKKMASGTSDAITRPGHHHIELTTAGVSHHCIEPWPFGLHAGDLVCVFLDDRIAALGSHLTQIEDLCLGILIVSRNPRVERGALHARRPFFCGVVDPYLAT